MMMIQGEEYAETISFLYLYLVVIQWNGGNDNSGVNVPSVHLKLL
jgi:hypothetical protein